MVLNCKKVDFSESPKMGEKGSVWPQVLGAFGGEVYFFNFYDFCCGGDSNPSDYLKFCMK